MDCQRRIDNLVEQFKIIIRDIHDRLAAMERPAKAAPRYYSSRFNQITGGSIQKRGNSYRLRIRKQHHGTYRTYDEAQAELQRIMIGQDSTTASGTPEAI